VFRKPTRGEITLLKRTYSKLGCFDYFVQWNKCILIKDGSSTKIREVYLISESAGELAISVKPAHAGILIGRLGNRLSLTLEGAGIVYRAGCKVPFVTVNENGERLVLYGRDVFGQSIIDASIDIRANQNLVILNNKLEVIAIGRARYPNPLLFKQDSITVMNLLDVGYYLRHQDY
jgi:60S ribosome subunit biogenesis protein NIP7